MGYLGQESSRVLRVTPNAILRTSKIPSLSSIEIEQRPSKKAKNTPLSKKKNFHACCASAPHGSTCTCAAFVPRSTFDMHLVQLLAPCTLARSAPVSGCSADSHTGTGTSTRTSTWTSFHFIWCAQIDTLSQLALRFKQEPDRRRAGRHQPRRPEVLARLPRLPRQ